MGVRRTQVHDIEMVYKFPKGETTTSMSYPLARYAYLETISLSLRVDYSVLVGNGE